MDTAAAKRSAEEGLRTLGHMKLRDGLREPNQALLKTAKQKYRDVGTALTDPVTPPPPKEEPKPPPPPAALGAPPWGSSKTKYDATVNSVAAIEAAAAKATNAGKVFAIEGGSYEQLDLSGGNGSPFGPSAGLVTFIPVPGDVVSIKGIGYRFSRNMRFEGMRFTGAADMVEASTGTPNEHLEFYGCEFGGYTGDGIKMWVNSRDVLAEGCYFHDLAYGNVKGGDNGYGVRCSGGGSTNYRLAVKGCHFEYLADDCLQLSSVKGVLIDRCEFNNWNRYQNGRSGATTDAHPDCIQSFGGQEVTLSNSYMHSGGIEQGVFFEIGYPSLHVDNCFLSGAGTYGLVMQDGAGWGNATGSTNVVVENTTVWGNGIPLTKNTDHAAGSVLRNCLLEGMNMLNGADWKTNDKNQIGGSPTFNADKEAQNYAQGYRKPSGVWW